MNSREHPSSPVFFPLQFIFALRCKTSKAIPKPLPKSRWKRHCVWHPWEESWIPGPPPASQPVLYRKFRGMWDAELGWFPCLFQKISRQHIMFMPYKFFGRDTDKWQEDASTDSSRTINANTSFPSQITGMYLFHYSVKCPPLVQSYNGAWEWSVIRFENNLPPFGANRWVEGTPSNICYCSLRLLNSTLLDPDTRALNSSVHLTQSSQHPLCARHRTRQWRHSDDS